MTRHATFISLILFTQLLTLFPIQAAHQHPRQNPCAGPCGNVLAAISTCSNGACLCPTLIPSGASCSACLAQNNDPTGAAEISSYVATVCVCSEECASASAAIAQCTSNAACLCPTFSVLGPPCISCLDELGLASDAVSISSVLYTDCPLALDGQACSEACESIPAAITSCNSKAQCVCPSLPVLGPPCTSCLASLGLTSAYSTFVSDLLEASSLCALVPKIEICSNECGSVVNAVSFCSPNDQCLCPTLSVLAPACISCAALLGDTTYAATLSSFLVTDCQAAAASPTPQIPTATFPGGGTTATVTATETTTTGASPTTGAKSGAQGIWAPGFFLNFSSTVLVILVVAGSVGLFF